MKTVFVSYASEDKDRVDNLVHALEIEGVRCWYDEDLVAGDDFKNEIFQRLNECDAVVVCWSEHSVRSEWVKAEAILSKREEKIVSVVLDGVKPPEIFSNFHHTEYQCDRNVKGVLEGIRKASQEKRRAFYAGIYYWWLPLVFTVASTLTLVSYFLEQLMTAIYEPTIGSAFSFRPDVYEHEPLFQRFFLHAVIVVFFGLPLFESRGRIIDRVSRRLWVCLFGAVILSILSVPFASQRWFIDFILIVKNYPFIQLDWLGGYFVLCAAIYVSISSYLSFRNK